MVDAHESGYLDLPGIAQALWLPDSTRILFRRTADLKHVRQRPVQGGEEAKLGGLPEKGRLQDVFTGRQGGAACLGVGGPRCSARWRA